MSDITDRVFTASTIQLTYDGYAWHNTSRQPVWTTPHPEGGVMAGHYSVGRWAR